MAGKQVRISDEAYDKLLKAATQDRRSLKVFLELLIEKHL
jgi:predicted CopG family antitoxin